MPARKALSRKQVSTIRDVAMRGGKVNDARNAINDSSVPAHAVQKAMEEDGSRTWQGTQSRAKRLCDEAITEGAEDKRRELVQELYEQVKYLNRCLRLCRTKGFVKPAS